MTSETPTDRADRALALDAEATPGPWEMGSECLKCEAHHIEGPAGVGGTGIKVSVRNDNDLPLIAAYRSLAPALARDVKTLSTKVERLRTAIDPAIRDGRSQSHFCNWCYTQVPGGGAHLCGELAIDQLKSLKRALREAEEVRE